MCIKKDKRDSLRVHTQIIHIKTLHVLTYRLGRSWSDEEKNYEGHFASSILHCVWKSRIWWRLSTRTIVVLHLTHSRCPLSIQKVPSLTSSVAKEGGKKSFFFVSRTSTRNWTEKGAFDSRCVSPATFVRSLVRCALVVSSHPKVASAWWRTHPSLEKATLPPFKKVALISQ